MIVAITYRGKFGINALSEDIVIAQNGNWDDVHDNK